MTNQAISTAKIGNPKSVYIKADFVGNIQSKIKTKSSSANTPANKGKAIVRDLFKNNSGNEPESILFSYTIQGGDQKRLNKGILKVYNIAEPVNIPVVELLGKWNNSFIGKTLAFVDYTWVIQGDTTDYKKHNQENIFSKVFSRILSFAG